MDIFKYHWIWYLIGIMNMPRLTLMIFVDIYLNIPLIAKIIFTLWAGMEDGYHNALHTRKRG
jgi:hypothetical protein